MEKEFKFIETLRYSTIVDLILNARKRLYISLPGIDQEIAAALIGRDKTAKISIVVDNSEETIRNGFGEISAIDLLQKQGFQINQCSGNLVSYIISDNIGYFLFPQSKIFSENPIGPNAIKIDPLTTHLLIRNYFPADQIIEHANLDYSGEVDAFHEHFQVSLTEIKNSGVGSYTTPFDNKKYAGIKKKLEINPPLSPNLQRQINTYTAKIQFVELKFTGGNIENRIAQLPKESIPINSVELKSLLLTRIKMFQDISEHEEYKKFQLFKDKIEKLRKEFLTPITCRTGKSIIKLKEKESFLQSLNELNEEAKGMNQVLTTLLEEGILNTLDLLRKELVAFFNINEPPEVKDILRLEIKERKISSIINSIISSIKFPDVSTLIEKISLSEQFYDLTWNDFKDEKLLGELKEKKIMDKNEIEQIVELKKAFDIKN